MPTRKLRQACVSSASRNSPGARPSRESAAAVHLAKVDIAVPDVSAFRALIATSKCSFLARTSAASEFFQLRSFLTQAASGQCNASVKLRCHRQKENLRRLTDEVELAVQTAYNKLERTQQMLSVSQELLATRAESSRVLQQELAHGAARQPSRAHMAVSSGV